MASRHQREKRLARRAAAQGPSTGTSLLPHTAKCPCSACEEQRKTAIKIGVTHTDRRRRNYQSGHNHPEHRSEWLVSGHALIEFMKLHTDARSKGKVTMLDLRPAFVAHLDGLQDESDLAPGLLYEALLMLEHEQPLRGRIVRQRCIERKSQAEIAASEYMVPSTVSRNLDAGLERLQELYGGLLLIEQHRAAV